jgi:HAMP domain-containing protein
VPGIVGSAVVARSSRAVSPSPGVTPDQLVAWRRRALDQQLPAASFPAGASAPSLVFLWAMMFAAVVAVFGFAVHDGRRVPDAIHDSQRDLVAKVGRDQGIRAGRAIDDLDDYLDGVRHGKPRPDPDLLTQVVGDGQTWSGAAIVAPAGRQQTAGTGVPVPLDLLPTPLPADATVPAATRDGPALFRIVRLDDARTLVAMLPLLMRNLRLNPDTPHAVFMITPDGTITLMQGVDAVGTDKLPQVLRGTLRVRSASSHAVVVRQWSDRQLVVASAPVGDTGITIASVLVADVTAGMSTVRGLVLGGSLLAVAVVSFLLMRRTLVRPLRALLRRAQADACGAEPDTQDALTIVEAYRIAQALPLSSGRGRRSRRWQPTVTGGLVIAALVGFLWPAGAVATALRAPRPHIPAQLVFDEESRAEAATSTVGNALDTGLHTVMGVPLPDGAPNLSRYDRLLREALGSEHRLRNLYLVDGAGRVLRVAGRAPLRPAAPLAGESGVDIDRRVTRLPLVFAYHKNNGPYAVVGEFDVDNLLDIMRRVDGRARLVDADLRTIVDSQGYRAYQPLSGTAVRDAAAAALAGDTVGRVDQATRRPALIAAAAVSQPDTVAHLEWVVVVERDVTALQLPEVLAQRWTLLIAGGVAGIGLLTLAWHLLIFARPLRRLAAVADRIHGGDLDLPVAPQRHDEIGAIAICVEICRQVQRTGSVRFGGAIRIRGSEDDFTDVLPRITDDMPVPTQRRAEPAVRS